MYNYGITRGPNLNDNIYVYKQIKWYDLGPNVARSQETASLRNLNGKCLNDNS